MRKISVEAVGQLEFSVGRAAYKHLNGAHRPIARRRVAAEVDPVFDGHDRLGGRGEIVISIAAAESVC